MPMGKRIGAAGAVAVTAVLCGLAMAATVHEALAAGLLPPRFFEDRSPLPTEQYQKNLVLPNPENNSACGVLAGCQEKDEVRLPPPPPSGLNGAPTYDLHLNATVDDLYAQAGPGIVAKLKDAHGTLTKNDVESVISNELVSTINDKMKKPGSDISFEILTGKLKIQKAKTIWGVDISGGEVNIYKISEALAAMLYACEKLSSPQFSNCLDAVMADVRTIVIEAIGENDLRKR
jgi:hypothetical protein